MVGVHQVRRGHGAQQLLLDGERGAPRCEAGAVGDPENVCVDRHGRLAESGVEHHICCFAADSGQCFQLTTDPWNFSAVALDQKFAGFEDIGGLGVVKAERADGFAQCR